MRVDILTLFPEMFPPVLGHSIIGRARKKGLLQVCCHQLRDFSPDPRGRVDDTVFGGGKGMLLAADPFARGIDQLRAHLGWQPHILYMSPRGKVLAQEDAKRLAQEPGLVLLCGHYEGVDQRLLDEYQVEEISIGARGAVRGGLLYRGEPLCRPAGVPPVHPAGGVAGPARAAGAPFGPPREYPTVAPGPVLGRHPPQPPRLVGPGGALQRGQKASGKAGQNAGMTPGGVYLGKKPPMLLLGVKHSI